MALGAVENNTSRTGIEMDRKSRGAATCVENNSVNRAMVGYFTFLFAGNTSGIRLQDVRATTLTTAMEIELRAKLRAASQEGTSAFKGTTPFSIAYFFR
jgi:hypothetical protein